jgi:hypothetical protein
VPRALGSHVERNFPADCYFRPAYNFAAEDATINKRGAVPKTEWKKKEEEESERSCVVAGASEYCIGCVSRTKTKIRRRGIKIGGGATIVQLSGNGRPSFGSS